MFQLRQAQLDVCAQAAEPDFEKSVMGHLREHHAPAVADVTDHVLHQRVRFGLASARRYGLTFENNLTAYVAYMFEFAPNFDEHPPIRAVLSDEAVPPDERIDLLLRRVSGDEWIRAKLNGDPKRWNEANG